MKIAILGWGSLVWQHQSLQLQSEFEPGGPELPIEFSRISADGRLTLVIDQDHRKQVRTRVAASRSRNTGAGTTQAMRPSGL